MIRNYYTEAYKGGIVPSLVAGQLIDGTVKITESTTSTSVVNTATSVTLVLTLNTSIKRGMYITGPTIAPSPIVINDHLMVEQVVHATSTTVTLSKPIQMDAGKALTFFHINQNSWKEYNLFIGTSPGSDGSSITTSNNNASTNTALVLKSPNTKIQVGMNVGGTGVPAGTKIATVTNSSNFIFDQAVSIAADVTLTYSFDVLPSVSVLTTDNTTSTFTNPAQGFVLPVSVVQITGVAGGLTNLIALN
mgnify:FL=1